MTPQPISTLACLSFLAVAACSSSGPAPGGGGAGTTTDSGNANVGGSGSGSGGSASGSGGSMDSAVSGGSSSGMGSSGSSGSGGGTASSSSGGSSGPPGAGDAGGATGSSDAAGAPQGGDAGGGGPSDGMAAPLEAGPVGDGGAPSPLMNFFVSSDTSMTGNLGGLTGADARCQRLATAVGHGDKTWRAYLSADSPVTNARDRIGNGPYYNSLGLLVAADNNALHPHSGDPSLFIDEHGHRINGQWTGSPAPLEHDILTGSTTLGMLDVGFTCTNWTATTGNSFVGHADGLGPGMSMAAMYTPWNSSHTGQCANTAPGGGAGRIYCFVGP
jgi:hypothetical protein